MKIILYSILFFCSLTASASTSLYGVGGGLRYTTPRFDGSAAYGNVESKNHLGFYVGFHYALKLGKTEKWSFRSGAELTQRNMKFEGPTDTLDLKYTFLDIPMLIQYNFNDSWGAFGGLKFAVTITDQCDGSNTLICEESGDDIPIVLGAQYAISQNSVIDFFYEHGLIYLVQSETFINGNSVAKYQIRYSGFGLSYIYYF